MSAPGLWDGGHALINTGTNGSANCSTTTWADITLSFAGGAKQVGFSLPQNELAVNVYINGSLFGTLPAGGGSRTGYFRFDVTGDSAPITSLLLDGHPGDAWVIDHVAVAAPVPEPGSGSLALAGAAALAGLLRRRRAGERWGEACRSAAHPTPRARTPPSPEPSPALREREPFGQSCSLP